MGFSDSQVAATVAHKHTNAAGDGGNLDTTTLTPNTTDTLVNTILTRAIIFGVSST